LECAIQVDGLGYLWAGTRRWSKSCSRGLARRSADEDGVYYGVTPRGLEFLDTFWKMKGFLEEFGGGTADGPSEASHAPRRHRTSLAVLPAFEHSIIRHRTETTLYYKSLLAVALSTALVIGLAAILVTVTSGVGTQPGQVIPTTPQTACQAGEANCVSFTITFAHLDTLNTTDLLGPVFFATLGLGVNVSGSGPITSFQVFIGNQSIGRVNGPFEPGVGGAFNLTVPATVEVSSGHPYKVNVEGFYGSGSDAFWQATEVVAH
jgi:hypothetical protein